MALLCKFGSSLGTRYAASVSVSPLSSLDDEFSPESPPVSALVWDVRNGIHKSVLPIPEYLGWFPARQLEEQVGGVGVDTPLHWGLWMRHEISEYWLQVMQLGVSSESVVLSECGWLGVDGGGCRVWGVGGLYMLWVHPGWFLEFWGPKQLVWISVWFQ